MSGFFYMITKQIIIDNLKDINYPGFSRDIVSFGLIKEIILEDNKVNLILKVKSNNENQINQLSSDIKKKLFDNLNIEAVEIQKEQIKKRLEIQTSMISR